MTKRKSYTPLNIMMNNQMVGKLSRQKGGAVSFQYAQEWIDGETRIPISLSLPLQEDRYIGAPVMAVFDNLLPDNEQILRRVAERVGAQGTDAYSMLSKIGRDCIGALQFVPEDKDTNSTGKVEGRPLSEGDIEALLNNLDISPLGIRPDNEFRISIAGAQDKTALLYQDGQWLEPIGTTPTTHIFKPQIGKLSNGMDFSDSVENEYFCLKLIEQFGLRVADVDIKNFGKQSALVIERFDRRWLRNGRLLRLPQEDCCQALSVPPTQKYESAGGPGIPAIMKLLRSSDDPNQDQRDFFKANILFWLIGATDGHAKNFSISLLPEGRFRMTPFYDVLTAEPEYQTKRIRRKDYKMAMRYGNTGHYKVSDVYPRHIEETGLASGLSRDDIAKIIAEIVEQAPKAIEQTIAALEHPIPQRIIDAVTSAITDRIRLVS